MTENEKLNKRCEFYAKCQAEGVPVVEILPRLAKEHPELCSTEANADSWESNPALRAEFQNDKQIYDAYCEAVQAGKVKIMGGVQR